MKDLSTPLKACLTEQKLLRGITTTVKPLHDRGSRFCESSIEGSLARISRWLRLWVIGCLAFYWLYLGTGISLFTLYSFTDCGTPFIKTFYLQYFPVIYTHNIQCHWRGKHKRDLCVARPLFSILMGILLLYVCRVSSFFLLLRVPWKILKLKKSSSLSVKYNKNMSQTS